MKFLKGSFKMDKSADFADEASKETAIAKMKLANIIGGCIYLVFGLVLIAEKAVTTFPTAIAAAFGVAAAASFFYIITINAKYFRVYNTRPDEYQAEILKNGKAQGYNFLIGAIVAIAVFFEVANRSSVPGLLFGILGVATLISQLSTKYDPKTPTE